MLKATKDFSTKVGKMQWGAEPNMFFLIKAVLVQSSESEGGSDRLSQVHRKARASA